MIKQLLRQIWTQRAANAWLWVELLVVSVCLWYITDFLYVTGSVFFSPLGYDYEHTYRVKIAAVSSHSSQYNPEEATAEKLTENYLNILTRLRSYPGIEEVAISGNGTPYNEYHSSGSQKIDTTEVHGDLYSVSPEYFSVFKLKDKQGNTQPLVEAARQKNTFIISAMAESEYEKEGCQVLGNSISFWKESTSSHTVKAIVADTRYDDFTPVYPAFYMTSSEVDIINNNSGGQICFRVKPQEDTPEFLARFRKEMRPQLRLGNLYMLDVASLKDYYESYYLSHGNINEVKTKIAALFFLLINIFLGIIGTFWIRTQHRRSELALRIALGSTKAGLRRLLIWEGLLILLFTVVPYLLITYNIGYAELLDNRIPFTLGRFVLTSIVTYGMIVLMIALGVSLPARQASKVQPAEALHEE